ncbi:MAG: hypothetical protein MUF52_03455 [Syntrophobacteraceae bacterium]|nr:hypothetical protein [Syntrophobacteraceae bacterium]
MLPDASNLNRFYSETTVMPKKIPCWMLFALLTVVGFAAFLYGATSEGAGRAWQAYLINFLLWSAVAQGGLLFSVVMTTVGARWAGPLEGLSQAFAGFFPVSLLLFLLLFLGGSHVFPWMHDHHLHGKEIWLNVPFLFTRDSLGLGALYLLGAAYVYHALLLKLGPEPGGGGPLRSFFNRLRGDGPLDRERIAGRMKAIGIGYILAFALVLSLIGYDLVMAADPHWVSTLFGPYTFVKAFYVGLAGLIIFASVMHLQPDSGFRLAESQFHDVGKLFFAFCLVWADFFYVQLVVIWYGNIPEETAYVIERTVTAPWRTVAWTVLIICFVAPFFILLNRKVKSMPRFMIGLCSAAIAGIWLEHLLLLGSPLSHSALALPLGIGDLVISLGFLGLMLLAIRFFLREFPELGRVEGREAR